MRWALLLALLVSLFQTAHADLVHRYSFSGNANDSVGAANGTAVTTPQGVLPTFANGQVQLDGAGGYIDLPNGIISKHTNITIEAWLTVENNANWARIFDFGTSTSGETLPDQPIGTGVDYMFLTANGAGTSNARFAITDDSNGAERPVLNDPDDFPVGTETHVALVYAPPVASLYVGGKLVATGTAVVPLSALQDVNNWLGRSQWADSFFAGSYNEFRIHDRAVGGPELKASQMGGPDALSYDPGTVSSVTITVTPSMVVGGAQTPSLSATFSVVGQATLAANEVELTSSATNVVAIGAGGVLEAKGVGTATITARRGGASGTATVAVTPANPAVLKHRYSFSGPSSSTTVTDSVGGQDGVIRPPFATTAVPAPAPVILTNNSALFPAGTTFDTAGYVDLPNGLISSKTNITIETWVTWNGPNAAAQNWARIFDFGNSTKGEDAQLPGSGAAMGYLFLTPRAGASTLRFVGEPTGGAENPVLNASPTLTVGQEAHVVVVYAPSLQTSRMYVNGRLVASGGAPFQLAALTDDNNWLGAAQYNDPPFIGAINEFRIYEGVLTDIEISVRAAAGPDVLPANPGTITGLSARDVTLLLGNPATTQASILAAFENAKDIDVTTAQGMLLTSSDPGIFTVSATGGLLPVKAGTARISASYQGLTTSAQVSVLAPVALRYGFTNTTLPAGGTVLTATLRADFNATLTNVDVTGFTGVTRLSTTAAATYAANGAVTPVAAGPTTLKTTYAGLSVQTDITVELPAGYKPGALVHRYSFSEQPGSTTVKDSVGNADGVVVGPAPSAGNNDFTGTGQLAMAGGAWNSGAGAYVDLPNGLVSKLGSVTLEGWATYRGGANNQRFFDFGMSSGVEPSPGVFEEDQVLNPGRSYMFLTPAAGPRFAIKEGTGPEIPSISSSAPFPVNTNAHFAVVYDQPNGVARLYVNGVRTGTAAATLPLSVVDDRNVWLGRSVWQDPLLNALYDEFRVYNGPLSDADIAASFAKGPGETIVPGQNEPTITQVKPKARVVWVSFHGADNSPTAAAAGVGFSRAPDVGYTDLLTASGYEVTRYVTTPTPDAALLNAADLVVISRSVPSGHYQDAAGIAWNNIKAPIIVMGGYVIRNSRMGFTRGATIPDTASTIRLKVNNPAHPIFAGVNLDGDNVMANPYAHIVSHTNSPQRGISVNTDPVAGNGTVLATVSSAGDPANGGLIIGEWNAGAVMANAAATPLAGRRLVLLSGSREQGITSEAAGIFDLDPDGAKLFLNAVAYMTTPAATPARLAITAAAGSIRIEWAGGGTLETADAVNGPWTPVTDAASPHNAAISGSTRFFRVRN